MSNVIQIKVIHKGMSTAEAMAAYEQMRDLDLKPDEWRAVGMTMRTGVAPSQVEVQADKQRDEDAKQNFGPKQFEQLYALSVNPFYAHLDIPARCALVRSAGSAETAR
jgi:hypothetical protein